MPQFINGDLTTKTPAEFDYQGFRGTPYCAIYRNNTLGKNRIYLLDTREKLYFPLAEWDMDNSDADAKWHEYLLSINDNIGKERHRLRREGKALSELDKVEQIVQDKSKMTANTADDTWSSVHRPDPGAGLRPAFA